MDPAEREVVRAFTKAKLLARVDQMIARGVKPDKKFTFRTSDEELATEVAKMELMAERAVRIQQGRAVFVPLVRGIETGANLVDRKGWAPVKLSLGGFGRQLHKDLGQYDDCLERGVTATIGPSGTNVWWVELLMILLPAMVTYGFSNRAAENPEYANELMRGNPELQQSVAQAVAAEISRTKREDGQGAQAELKRLRDENAALRQGVTPMPAPANTVPPNQHHPVIGRMIPPPKLVPTTHPLGDFKPNPADTQEMQALLSAQKQARDAAKPPHTKAPHTKAVTDQGTMALDDDSSSVASL